MNYSKLYYDELTLQVIPFWEKFSVDKEYGGFFTCINDKNQVFDTDKFVWLQARQIWTFATLYDQLNQNEHWLDISIAGAEFILNNAHDVLASLK